MNKLNYLFSDIFKNVIKLVNKENVYFKPDYKKKYNFIWRGK
jgi:hypothetical protein